MDASRAIDDFLAAGPFAVVGASRDRAKYGNKVLRAYLQRGLTVHPIHPTEAEIEGTPCYRSLSDMPQPPRAVSIVTPPPVTARIVEEAGRLGIHHLWMQPGAESPEAIRRAEELGIAVIAGGPCVLVKLRYREEPDA